jgi:acyl-CoA synthetase (AMP-forming)/AMP-acid ligase II
VTDRKSIWQLLERRVEIDGDHLFAIDELGRSMTFREARDAALGLAERLAERGVQPGAVVSWQLPNWIQAAVLSLAVSRLGATQNPVIPILGLREVRFICRQARSDLLVIPGRWRGFDYEAMAATVQQDCPQLQVLVAEHLLPVDNVDSVDSAGTLSEPPRGSSSEWYFYTSGTTADPKGARHTDDTLIAGATGFFTALGITDSDRLSMVIPLTHVGGIIHVLASIIKGCTLVFAETFDPVETTKQLREQRATLVPGSLPFVQSFFSYQDLHPEADPLFPAGRVMIHGGSPTPPQLIHDARARLGLPIVSGYGMTECPMSVWNRPDDDDQLLATTEGRAVPGVEIAIVTADGRRAETGEEGEVRLRGPQLMLGYVDASLDDSAIDEAGYFRSGDLGRLATSGHLTITGRLKDVIIRNMENISAGELENLLFTHPSVKDVAVIGVPDPYVGERACAVIVPTSLSAPPTLAELSAHLLSSGLSKRKLPERLEIVDELPRNAMRKVLKAELRRRFIPEPHDASL